MTEYGVLSVPVSDKPVFFVPTSSLVMPCRYSLETFYFTFVKPKPDKRIENIYTAKAIAANTLERIGCLQVKLVSSTGQASRPFLNGGKIVITSDINRPHPSAPCLLSPSTSHLCFTNGNVQRTFCGRHRISSLDRLPPQCPILESL